MGMAIRHFESSQGTLSGLDEGAHHTSHGAIDAARVVGCGQKLAFLQPNYGCAVLVVGPASAGSRHQRSTSTGIPLCVRTLCVSLPSNTPATPPRP